MKTQLLLATFAATLLITGIESAQAGNLGFAIATLKSAQRTSAQPARLPRAVAKTAVPLRKAEPAAPQLLLGVYVDDIDGGLKVQQTLPGSPASDVLKPGDILLRASVLGQPTRTLDTLVQFEHAKREIGVNRQAALEIFRPGSGIEYVWVTFRPAGELAVFTRDTQHAHAHTLFGTMHDTHVSR